MPYGKLISPDSQDTEFPFDEYGPLFGQYRKYARLAFFHVKVRKVLTGFRALVRKRIDECGSSRKIDPLLPVRRRVDGHHRPVSIYEVIGERVYVRAGRKKRLPQSGRCRGIASLIGLLKCVRTFPLYLPLRRAELCAQ